MKGLALLCAVGVCAAACAQAAPGTSFVLLRIRDGSVVKSDWSNAENPAPVGSLVKPITAIAYGLRHAMAFPTHVCTGRDCWLKTGHGRIGLAEAIGHSCNSYFLQLANETPATDVAQAAERFGLAGPPSACSKGALIGLGREWPIAPLAVARAYRELAQRRTEPGIAQIIKGMGLAVRLGTASGVRSQFKGAVLAKTGTAPCSHSPSAPTDGYAILIYPGDTPEYVLLVQVHNTVGRQAASAAAVLLRELVGVR
jgi:cell division protein FtsI/penicillin-binding protein 2